MEFIKYMESILSMVKMYYSILVRQISKPLVKGYFKKTGKIPMTQTTLIFILED